MPYGIEYTPNAIRQLDRINKADRKRIIAKIDALAENPFPKSGAKLTGHKELYRIRVGDYRVVYTVDQRIVCVIIAEVGHRKEIYQKLVKYLR